MDICRCIDLAPHNGIHYASRANNDFNFPTDHPTFSLYTYQSLKDKENQHFYQFFLLTVNAQFTANNFFLFIMALIPSLWRNSAQIYSVYPSSDSQVIKTKNACGSQCSRIRIFSFFSDFKKHDFKVFLK